MKRASAAAYGLGCCASLLRRFATFAVVVAICGISACGVDGGGSGNATSPPCTSVAIQDAARKVIQRNGGTLQDVHGFKCSGSFAYAFVDAKYQANVDSVALLFKASGIAWVAVDRETYCTNGSLPKSLYVNACTAQ